jgi:hypothetical protein
MEKDVLLTLGFRIQSREIYEEAAIMFKDSLNDGNKKNKLTSEDLHEADEYLEFLCKMTVFSISLRLQHLKKLAVAIVNLVFKHLKNKHRKLI